MGKMRTPDFVKYPDTKSETHAGTYREGSVTFSTLMAASRAKMISLPLAKEKHAQAEVSSIVIGDPSKIRRQTVCASPEVDCVLLCDLKSIGKQSGGECARRVLEDSSPYELAD